MSDAASQVQANPPPEPRPTSAVLPPPPIARPRPRLWPGVVVVGLMLLAVWLPGWLDAPGMVRYLFVFFAPMVATAGVALWWLLFSRVPWIDRGLGFAAFGAGAAATAFLWAPNSMLLIVFALPVVLTVWVVWLFAAIFLSWPIVRAGLAVVLLLAWGAFCCLRFDGLDGSLQGTLSLRWSQKGEDKFLASQGSIGTAKGAAALTLQPGDWPCFRGPLLDVRLKGVRIATDWNQNPPKELWRHRVGPGWGSFAVIGDNIYTQEQRDKQESVVCYDALSGKQIWAHDDATRFDEVLGGAGPRATPTFHDGKIYTLGANGRLNCLDAATGAVVWSRDVTADAGASIPTWGFASSPLVVGDVVMVLAPGADEKSTLAYDAASGKPPVWSAPAGKMSYSSPQPAKLGGVEQVLCSTEKGLTAYDPAKGDVLWKYDQPEGMHRIVQPNVLGDSDVLLSSFMVGTTRVHVRHDPDGWKAEEVWSSAALKPNYNDMVVYDGFAYGYDADSFVCVNLEDGKQKWRTKAYGSGQVLLLADQGLLLVLTEKPCAAVLLEATPQGRKELGRFSVFEEKTWNHPVVAHGKLFVRNSEWAACYQLTPEGEPASGK